MLDFDTIQKLKEKGFETNNHNWEKDSKGIDLEAYADEVPINDESAKLLIDLKPNFVEFASCILGDNIALKITLADKYEELLLDTRNETKVFPSGLLRPQTPASFFLKLDDYLDRLGKRCGYDEMIDIVFREAFVNYYKEAINKTIAKETSQEL